MSSIPRWRRWFWFTVTGTACGAVFGLVQLQGGVRDMVPLVSPLVLGAVFGFVIDIVRAGLAAYRDALRR